MRLEHAIIKTLWRRKAEDGKPAGEALLVFDFDGGGYVLEGHDGGQRRIPSAEFEASWEPWSPEANAKCPTCGREVEPNMALIAAGPRNSEVGQANEASTAPALASAPLILTIGVTAAEVARHLTISKRKAYLLMLSGELPAFRVGRRLIAERDGLAAFIKRNRVAATWKESAHARTRRSEP